jgi:hypothetical protein
MAWRMTALADLDHPVGLQPKHSMDELKGKDRQETVQPQDKQTMQIDEDVSLLPVKVLDPRT